MNNENNNEKLDNLDGSKMIRLGNMYKNYFLDYASYVILERAVPHILDGLKPVQRRVLHAMKRLDDGRYNKVANIIGYTMQYHPHGDTSIGEALVQLGQKDILIDAQGNWGNVQTGDSAAASRYIEARLSKFALEVVFNPKTTKWKGSYDGRNKEPIALPVKFPLLLAQGVEGIAVGLASKILPHNFNELIDASVKYLQGKSFELIPDFPTAGLMDATRYNDGLRGGQIKLRAKIEKKDKKTIAITEIPYGKTTVSVIDSIIKANDKGKIKIKKIDDNTAENVEIVLHLANGISPDQTIDALYAFTDCEVSISPNACVIKDEKPVFIGVSDILKANTDNTLEMLKWELEIRLSELENSWHSASLEKIFIINELYEPIKECKTEEEIITTIDKGLEPFKKQLKQEVTREDIEKLSVIPIKRISKFSSFKADNYIKSLEDEMVEVKKKLDNIVEHTIEYFKNIKKKYGKGKERKSELRSFENIEATKVVVANEKLYVNRKEGFIGLGLKKDEYVTDCSDIDDIIAIKEDGSYIITKVADKVFVGKNIQYVGVFKKNDKRSVYNLIYRDGMNGSIYIKRCSIYGITRDREYDLTKGNNGSKILYLTVNPNGEAEIIRVRLKPRPKLRKIVFDYDFKDISIKGRGSQGNILTKYAIHKIDVKEKGVSTLGGRKIWWDETVLRLNVDERGEYLGEFMSNDQILVIKKSGDYVLKSFDLTNHFDDDILLIEKFNKQNIYSTVYYNNDQDFYYLKRFKIEPSDKLTSFIGDDPKNELILVSDERFPQIEIIFKDDRDNEIIDISEFIGIKSYKAKGKRLTTHKVKKIREIEPLQKEDEDDDAITETADTTAEDSTMDASTDSGTDQMKLF